MSGKLYTVETDLDPQALSAVGLEVYRMWVNFAMGREQIGGFRIEHPTGRYAASISYRRDGKSSITIMQDEELAPEGRYLEEGHAAYDMLGANSPYRGRVLPMHRGTGQGRPRAKPRGPKALAAARRKNIWAVVKEQGNNGSVRVPESRWGDMGMNTSGTGPAWTIPSLPAYSPAQHLADLAARVAVTRPAW